MEIDKEPENKTNKVSRLVINFVHEELLKQFINDNGQCNDATFSLLKGASNDEILSPGKITQEYQYKLIITYLIYYFSKYLKSNNIGILGKIRERLFDENSSRFIPFSMINELKKACLKMMASFAKKQPESDISVEIADYIQDQDIIGDVDLYEDYSTNELLNDVCNVIKIDQYINRKSLLNELIDYFDASCEDDSYIESSKSIQKCFETSLHKNNVDQPVENKSNVENHDTNVSMNEMIIDDIFDDETNEKENIESNSNVFIEKLSNGHKTFKVKKKSNKNKKILKEKSIDNKNNIHTDNTLSDDQLVENVNDTSKIKNKLNDEELYVSPKSSKKKLSTNNSEKQRASFDSDIHFSLQTEVSLNKKTNSSARKSSESGKDEEINNLKKEKIDYEPRRRSLRNNTKKDSNENIEIIDIDDDNNENEQRRKSPRKNSKKDLNENVELVNVNDKIDYDQPTTSKQSMLNNIVYEDDEDIEDDISTVSFKVSNFKKSNKLKRPSEPSKVNGKIQKKTSIKEKILLSSSSSSDSSSSSSDENEVKRKDSSSGKDEKNFKQKTKLKKSRVKWNEKEILYLVYGVEKYGKGNWASILSMFKSKFQERTNVDLKDKYRNLERNEKDLDYYKRQAKFLKDKIKNQCEKSKSNIDEFSSDEN